MKKLLCLFISACILIGIIPFTESIRDITKRVCIDDFVSQVQELNREYKDEPASNRIIVKSKYNIPSFDSVAIAEGYDGLHIVQFDNVQSASKALAYYEEQKLIDYAEADMTVSTCDTNAIKYNSHLSWGSETIGVDDYIDYLGDATNFPEIVVGIIDTGVDIDHEFLKDRVIETGFNLTSSGESDSEDDDNGHGTHVAGVVVDNTTDNVKVKGYKVLDDLGRGTISNAAIAIYQAVDDGVNVINMSLGCSGTFDFMTEAVKAAVKNNVTVCVAAGNSGKNAINYSPAGISECITVAAIDFEKNLPKWTNWGGIVDIVAPGVDIYSTYFNNTYESLSGTSMASPFAAAASALLLSGDKSLTPYEICTMLQENGRDWSQPDWLNKRYLYIGSVTDYREDRTSEPIISMPGGYYEDVISVEITCDDENAEIYYTTDGKRANKSNGKLYDGPITIDRTIKLSAIAYSPNKLESVHSSENYYLLHTDDESNFEIDDNGIITKYTGDNQYLIVPDVINGITVTGIGEKVFYKTGMTRIILPDTVTYIGEYSFGFDSELVSVKAGNLKEIDRYAFFRCKELSELVMPNVENIKRYAFYNTRIESLYCDNLKIVGDHAFYNCQYLISLDLPVATSIEDGAFYNCCKLETVNIPNVETIGVKAFIYNNLLTEINMQKVVNIEKGAFTDARSLNNVYLPEVRKISESVFYQCYEITMLYLPCAEEIGSFPACNGADIYLSDSFNQGGSKDYYYNIIAPSGSYAQQWANEKGHTFLDCESCSFTCVSGNDFIYTCSTNNETCTMPANIVEQMWKDYKPFNKSPDFIPHGFLLNIIPDRIINGKDFVKIIKS